MTKRQALKEMRKWKWPLSHSTAGNVWDANGELLIARISTEWLNTFARAAGLPKKRKARKR